MIAAMAQTGVFYHGLSILGGGSILAGVILGSVTVFIIDRKYASAAMFAAAGGVLTFFGLMHGEEVGIKQNPTVVAAYFIVGAILYAASRYSVAAPLTASEMHEEEEHGHAPAAAPLKPVLTLSKPARTPGAVLATDDDLAVAMD